jgi:glycosyltransferase involved in cell wall biosynthesis
MLLSIVIPVYNVEEYIEKCILSCVNQDVPLDKYEIIIVNDGSPDDSLNICKRLEKEFANIKIITQKNKGLSGARNTGLKNSIGEYVWFVDSDDWITKDCLKSIYEAVNTYKSDIFWLGHDVISNKKVINKFIPKETLKPIDGNDFFINHLDNKFYIWKFIYKREFLISNDLSFYEGLLYEDLEFTPRALHLAKSCYNLPNIYYHYLMRDGSIVNNVKIKNVEDRFFIFNRLFEYMRENKVPESYYKTLYNSIIDSVFTTLRIAAKSNLKLTKSVKNNINNLKVESVLSSSEKIHLNIIKKSTNLYMSLFRGVYKILKMVKK